MKTGSKQQIVLQFTMYQILRLCLPVFQTTVHIQSHNNIDCTPNTSVPFLQQRCTAMTRTFGWRGIQRGENWTANKISFNLKLQSTSRSVYGSTVLPTYRHLNLTSCYPFKQRRAQLKTNHLKIRRLRIILYVLYLEHARFRASPLCSWSVYCCVT
jgi:hypothetical protein